MTREPTASRVLPQLTAELVRLPNLFTAMADVAMGFLFVQPRFGRKLWMHIETMLTPLGMWVLGLLVAASSLLYAAGVVLNDVFDVERDRDERPERPLPSGRISLRAARWLGWELLLLGTVAAGCASACSSACRGRPSVAVLLAGCIVLYDAVLKRTLVGPARHGRVPHAQRAAWA